MHREYKAPARCTHVLHSMVEYCGADCVRRSVDDSLVCAYRHPAPAAQKASMSCLGRVQTRMPKPNNESSTCHMAGFCTDSARGRCVVQRQSRASWARRGTDQRRLTRDRHALCCLKKAKNLHLCSGNDDYTLAMPPERTQSRLTQVVGVLQLVALIIGVAGMFLVVGKRDQQLTHVSTDLDKLAGAVNDLARAQASAAVNDATHARSLEDILRRLNNIEGTMKR